MSSFDCAATADQRCPPNQERSQALYCSEQDEQQTPGLWCLGQASAACTARKKKQKACTGPTSSRSMTQLCSLRVKTSHSVTHVQAFQHSAFLRTTPLTPFSYRVNSPSWHTGPSLSADCISTDHTTILQSQDFTLFYPGPNLPTDYLPTDHLPVDHTTFLQSQDFTLCHQSSILPTDHLPIDTSHSYRVKTTLCHQGPSLPTDHLSIDTPHSYRVKTLLRCVTKVQAFLQTTPSQSS